ncbi:MAG: hypothetical protein WBA97_28320 [Actinophytocola sp.]|uniref:hypothetical protein n=1 Tax=Actinophytocola sp. TaxID=1872138 RepID=UPI003C72F25A
MTRERSGDHRVREWPPTPYPPRERNPQGDDLLDPIDWMTFSHRDLHLMATTRLHVETARELSGEWSRVGRKLDAIADKLIRLNKLMRVAWEGGAAEVARQTGEQLSTWADETGRAARGVADYLDRHASNAEWASREMPEPDGDRELGWLPNWRRDDPDDGGSDAGPVGQKPTVNGGGPAPSSAGQIDFDAARFLVEDEGEARERRQHKHRRAAEIMTRMQANAVEIFGTVPRFTKPAVSGRQGIGHGGNVSPDVRTADEHPFGATAAAGHPGSSGVGTAGGGPETAAPGARSPGSGLERPASGIPVGGMTGGSPGSGGLDGGRVRGQVGLGAVPLGGPAAVGGTDRRGGPVGMVSPRAPRGVGNDKRRARALVGGDASIFEPDEDPAPEIAVTGDAEYDEMSRSPVDEPLRPISLARLPGNWVRRGA